MSRQLQAMSWKHESRKHTTGNHTKLPIQVLFQAGFAWVLHCSPGVPGALPELSEGGSAPLVLASFSCMLLVSTVATSVDKSASCVSRDAAKAVGSPRSCRAICDGRNRQPRQSMYLDSWIASIQQRQHRTYTAVNLPFLPLPPHTVYA